MMPDLLAFLFIFIRNDIKRRKRAKKELYRINSHLDKIVKERTLELQNTIHELEISKEKAEASDRLKTAFLNNISHEICTPLNGILGFAPLIIQPDCSIEEKEMYLDRLNNSSERLINTVTAFMDISMIVSNNLEVSFKEMEISPLILEIYNQYKKACQKKSIDLIMELPENEQDYIFKTDENLLRKTLSHLMDNAIKFTHIGSIIIGAKFKGKTLELFVKDTGQGIAKEEQKRVFDFFMQENIDNTRGHEGSGLGLSILKGIIKLLSGNLNLVSEKDKGTAIYITLPIETDKTIPKA